MSRFMAVAQSTIFILCILLAVAFLTLIERKILGYMQNRKGPNVVGPLGVLQPIADGAKLFLKEPIRPSSSSQMLFTSAPSFALTLALFTWAPFTMPAPLADLNLGIIFILAISSLTVYATLASGWASNSKYALIGALRAVAQTISYEVAMALIILCTIFLVGGFSLWFFNVGQEFIWLTLPAWPLLMMWVVSTLAETNRAPFDLTEGESELVSGFNVEYAGGTFALFFLAEYANILMMNTLTTIIFLGSMIIIVFSTFSLMVKASLLVIMFLWVRAAYPRFRYDQLMHLVWKNFLPLTIGLVTFHITFPTSSITSAPHV
uniref:NADH dehydrogenase subunit 1 n=1 Tax=Ptychadena wadei TaxID=1342839 RepID=UPI00286BD4C3|nr:NADH dehydrogenase subunit 1 [Ptychadena wadei]WKT09039.1 NADH dehydrogenase subunit 1 [Ptychadena wadei]